MANGKIKTLYSDKEKTEVLFPRTKISAISDENGIGLDAIIDSVTYSGYETNEFATVPFDADSLGGLPAESYATQAFVANKIAEAQLDGSDTNIDLSGLATKDDLSRLLPISGGTMTGELGVGSNVRIWTDTEGGNIRITPPSSNTHTNCWEIDSYNGNELRLFVDKKSTNANGSGYAFPLTLYTDGSISTGNAAKTRDNLGITPANIGAAPANHTHGATLSVSTPQYNYVSIFSYADNESICPLNATTFLRFYYPTDGPETNCDYYARITRLNTAAYSTIELTQCGTGRKFIAYKSNTWSGWNWRYVMDYGTSLPAAGHVGRIFFKKV